MTVPCSCQIPDPVVVNGTCLVCYGERESWRDDELYRTVKTENQRPVTQEEAQEKSVH